MLEATKSVKVYMWNLPKVTMSSYSSMYFFKQQNRGKCFATEICIV